MDILSLSLRNSKHMGKPAGKAVAIIRRTIPILRLYFFDTSSTDQVRNLLACWLRTYSFLLSIQIMKGTPLKVLHLTFDRRKFLQSRLFERSGLITENRICSCNGNVEKLHNAHIYNTMDSNYLHTVRVFVFFFHHMVTSILFGRTWVRSVE